MLVTRTMSNLGLTIPVITKKMVKHKEYNPQIERPCWKETSSAILIEVIVRTHRECEHEGSNPGGLRPVSRSRPPAYAMVHTLQINKPRKLQKYTHGMLYNIHPCRRSAGCRDAQDDMHVFGHLAAIEAGQRRCRPVAVTA
jgi:hypothetical protein